MPGNDLRTPNGVRRRNLRRTHSLGELGMEAVLKEKFIKLVRNMPLEIVKDTLSED